MLRATLLKADDESECSDDELEEEAGVWNPDKSDTEYDVEEDCVELFNYY